MRVYKTGSFLYLEKYSIDSEFKQECINYISQYVVNKYTLILIS